MSTVVVTPSFVARTESGTNRGLFLFPSFIREIMVSYMEVTWNPIIVSSGGRRERENERGKYQGASHHFFFFMQPTVGSFSGTEMNEFLFPGTS